VTERGKSAAKPLPNVSCSEYAYFHFILLSIAENIFSAGLFVNGWKNGFDKNAQTFYTGYALYGILNEGSYGHVGILFQA